MTGHEQYLWERAGYFVRRGMVPPGQEPAEEELLAAAEEVLGPGTAAVGWGGGAEWAGNWFRKLRRYNAGYRRNPRGLAVFVAICPQAAVDVVPGSHEAHTRCNEAADDDWVCVRLDHGDALFTHPDLLRRFPYEATSRALQPYAFARLPTGG